MLLNQSEISLQMNKRALGHKDGSTVKTTTQPEILLYQFFISSIINYHKLCVLKQYQFIILLFCENSHADITGLKSNCQQSHDPFWKLQRRLLFLALFSIQSHLHSLACGLFPPFSNSEMVTRVPFTLYLLILFSASSTLRTLIRLSHLFNPG